jgi:hypothetical protein
MKRTLLLILLCSLSLNTFAQTRRRAAVERRAVNPQTVAKSTSQTLPIRRVILYSNGVAYIERRGTVTGHAEIDLSFKQSQVDDVLKSMVVLDLGQGRIGAVSYNSSAPPSARMADIPFSIQADSDNENRGGLAGVLSQLQGARVQVSTASRTANGSILTIEERKSQIDANKPALVSHTLVIASEGGELMSFDLADVRSIKLVDEGTRRDVNEFANATASARRRDAKTIVVTSDGAGSREMLVSYIIAAPIWKTTYRVVLDSSGKPFFQGWAIVDNVSEEDWNNISLSLVSGSPVSFIQPIQKPFYRYRPVVPIPSDLKLDPQTYEPGEGGNFGAGGGTMNLRKDGVNEIVSVPGNARFNQAQINQLPVDNRGVQSLSALSPTTSNNYVLSGGATNLSDAITRPNSGVETAATGAEVGDLFEYKIDQAVTVLRDRSALIPIVQTRMEGERVSIYNEGNRADRAMGGMLLKNTSPLTLEGGALTVIDGDAYAGEALMERLKPGEQRLISFALDLGTLVSARAKEDRAPAFMVRAINGVFQAHYYQTTKRVYTLTNQTEKPRVVYIEHPVHQDWTLTDDTPKPDIKTARYYRFRVPLEAHGKAEIAVTERRALMDSYALTNFSRPDLELFISRKYIDSETRTQLEKILDLKSKMTSTDAHIESIDKEVNEIGEDQSRLRDNIKALTATAEAKQLISRYVAKADTQETRLEQLNKDKQTLHQERVKVQTDLESLIRGMSMDRQLDR